MSRLNEYQVIGRRLPTDSAPEPKLFRMRIFAPNTVVAKSRYWYFYKNCTRSRKPLVKLFQSMSSTKLSQPRLRLLVSGLDTNQDPVSTTCTRNTEMSPESVLLKPCTKIWLLDTELDLEVFTF